MSKVKGVPRRANQVAKFAAEVAAKQVARVQARQHVSDKIGYAVAVSIGAIAGYLAWWAGLVAIGFYAATAYRATARYRETNP